MNQFTVSDLQALAEELFPLNRSVVGRDYDASLDLIGNHVDLEIFEVESGTEVMDWRVPEGWSVKSGAGVFNLDGSLALDLSDSSLRIVSHSSAANQIMTGLELKKLMHTIPSQPDWIPYVTSYYKETVGFCGTQRELDSLDDEAEYRLVIPVEKYKHSLKLAEVVIPGATKEEILVSTYLCHPSLGNNELSGPLAWLRLIHLLQNQGEQNRYTYRFLLAPETIGTIAWIATRLPELSERINSAVVLTCLGGPEQTLSVKLSNHSLVWGTRHILDDYVSLGWEEGRWSTREFSPLNGSDERQLSSPGVRIPTIQIARTVYGEYEEYHTSADNLEFMSVERVCDSADKLLHFLRDFEFSSQPLSSKIRGGEPQLGKRGLYPTLSTPGLHYGSSRKSITFNSVPLDDILATYHLIDGRTAIEVAKISGMSLGTVTNAVRLLQSRGVIN